MTRYYNKDDKIITDITSSTFREIEKIFIKKQGSFKNIGLNIFDIGANIGIYSIGYSQIPKSKIFSFEPFPETYNYLCKNISINKKVNINAFNFGLFDKNKSLTMGVPKLTIKIFLIELEKKEMR